jgi:glycosyltransferase involved in cell wall biosynthesis
MKLLVFQSAYPYKVLCERNLLDFATSKDLGGFFDTVYTVHAAATVEFNFNSRERYGRITTYNHSSNQIFIEAKFGRYWHLRKLPLLNFIISQIGLIFYLVWLFWEEKDLLIRAEDPRYNGLLGFLLSRVKRLPFIVGTWGNPDSIRRYTGVPLQPRVFRSTNAEAFCERYLLRRADCVLVQNEDNFNYAVLFGAKAEQVKYFRLGNAIYPEHFIEPELRTYSPSEQAKISHNGYKVCTISRLENLKIVDDTLKSFKAMKSSIDSQLYIFGDGSQRDSLMKLASELGIADRIHFLGNVDQQILARLLPHMDLVLSPSMGRALTEAALAGLPIVAYDTDCHPEIVKTGQTGILVKYLDVKGMAEAGDFMLENPIEARRMGIAARDWALDLMNPEKLIREQRQIFSELIKMKYRRLPKERYQV